MLYYAPTSYTPVTRNYHPTFKDLLMLYNRAGWRGTNFKFCYPGENDYTFEDLHFQKYLRYYSFSHRLCLICSQLPCLLILWFASYLSVQSLACHNSKVPIGSTLGTS